MPGSRKRGYVVSGSGNKALHSYNISVGRKRTTVRLAPEIYKAIDKIAEVENCNIKKIFEFIARTRDNGVGLSNAIRVFAVQYFMAAATEEGHRKAGHGTLIQTDLIPRLELGDRPELTLPGTKATPRSSSDLAEIGQLLYGNLWRTELARHLGVVRQTVVRWADGAHPVPEDITADIHQLLRGQYERMERRHGSLIETDLIPKLELGDRQELTLVETKACTPLSPPDLADIGQLLYGNLWKTELARHLDVSRQTVIRWAGGTHPVPEDIAADIHQLVREKHKRLERKLYCCSVKYSGALL
jgi:predicted DNA-binding ribbon-helix-helix protein/DNA-binding XRE family transcriptional regulator